MNKNNQNKQVSNSGTGKEAARVARYIGAEKIEERMKKGDRMKERGYGEYIEAFAHTVGGIQLGQ